MDIGIVIGIIGTIATIIFGILSVYLVIKRKYPGEITFIQEECINLIDTIAKNFDDISIKYRSHEIQEDIIYIRGVFLNSGNIDINDGMVEKELTFNIPQGYKWLNSKITKSSSNINKEIENEDDNNLNFKLGLFRKKEFIQFEGLIECQKREDNSASTLVDNLIFNHRISDVKKIAIKEIATDIHLKKMKRRIRLAYMMIGVMVLYIALFIALFQFSDYTNINYKSKKDGVEYSARVHTNGEVELKPIDGGEEIEINYLSLYDIDQFEPKISNREFNSFFPIIIFLGVFLLLSLAYLGLSMSEFKQSKKLNTLLKKEDES